MIWQKAASPTCHPSSLLMDSSDLNAHLSHFLDERESAIKMASWLVHPFCTARLSTQITELSPIMAANGFIRRWPHLIHGTFLKIMWGHILCRCRIVNNMECRAIAVNGSVLVNHSSLCDSCNFKVNSKYYGFAVKGNPTGSNDVDSDSDADETGKTGTSSGKCDGG